MAGSDRGVSLVEVLSIGTENVPVIGIRNVPVRRLPREAERPERGSGPGVRLS